MDITIILIVAALGVAGFIMLSDTKKNDNFAELEKQARDGADEQQGPEQG
jgi:preprotein translocase subunit SecG